MNMPLVLLNRRRRGGSFSPYSLFSASEPGVWYDPSDMSTLYQNAAGTIPVTSFGQPVGLMLDKSRGLVLGPELVVNGDFSAGTTGWSLAVGWTVSGGTANINSAAGAAQITSTSFSSVVGATYIAKFTIVSASGTGVRLILGGAVVTGFLNVPGEYTYYLRPTTTGSVSVAAGGTDTIASIDNISVKELPGLHATQSTEASRPMYSIEPVGGRRNLLTWSEGFDNAAWTRIQVLAVGVNAAVAPDGTTTADRLTPNTANDARYVAGAPTVTPGFPASMTHSVYVKPDGYGKVAFRENATSGAYASFDAINGTVLATGNAGAVTVSTPTITNVGNGWYRISAVFTASASITQGFSVWLLSPSYTTGAPPALPWVGNGTDGILLWGAQLELGSTDTPYQRVTTQYDVTEAGVASVGYLYFDGVNDAMATSTITPGIDKAQVFTGVRKLSDVAAGIIAELGTTGIVAGGLRIGSSTTAGDASRRTWFMGQGNGAVEITAGVGIYPSPDTRIQTGLFDRAGATLQTEMQMRLNGAAQTLTYSTTDLVTGNFDAQPLYLGARNQSSVFFTGHLYSLITRFGPTLDAPTIASTETWVAGKTGIVI